MGLNQDDPNQGQPPAWRDCLLPGITVSVAVGLAFAGDAGRLLLRFDRSAIASGEIWRLLSGHFVHLGWTHLLLNLIGLSLVAYLVAARFRAMQWLFVGLVTIAVIDLGFWILEPQLEWYVGLSGLLHGILAAGVVAGMRTGHREAWLLAAVLIAKLLYEQFVGPAPGSAQAAGGAVVVAAHLYGAIGGGISAAFLPVRVRAPRPI